MTLRGQTGKESLKFMKYRREEVCAREVFRAPYVWQERDGVLEACMPGAYLRFAAEGSELLGVGIDRRFNRGCPANSMPVVEYFVDGGPVGTAQIPPPEPDAPDEYPLILAEGLDPAVPHTAEFHFRAANLMLDRWSDQKTHLRIGGVLIGEKARLRNAPRRSRLAIGFGDSITEGVGAVKRFSGWDDLSANRAPGSWFPLACSVLDCEYGQLGTGGQGVVRDSPAMPALRHTWSRYSEQASRLNGGLLLPEPDYFFCAMGTNDFKTDISEPLDIEAEAGEWLRAVRRACPRAWIFWLVPPLGMHDGEIGRAVEALRAAGDDRVFRIDTASLRAGFDRRAKPSRYADDGIHPNGDGAARLGALTAAAVRAMLERGGETHFQ